MFPTDEMPVAFCRLCHKFSGPGVPVTEHAQGCAYGPARRAERAFYAARLSRCPDFRRWPLPARYRPSSDAVPDTAGEMR